MNHRFQFLTLSAVLLAASLTANASDLDYSYAELRIVDTEVGSADGDGLRLNGSYEITREWLLVGGYTTLDFDGADLDTFEIGAGYVYPFQDNWDLVSYAKIVHADVDSGGFSDDETGFSLAGGFRGLFTPQFEGRATINYIDLDDSDTFFEIGGDYYFNSVFSAGATLEFGGDADTLTIGARWFFGGGRRSRGGN